MNTYEWAKHELDLARENEIAHAVLVGDEDYGIMCYDAAEQLLAVFQEQGHSGYSAKVVKEIFSRLVDGKPLTPVTDEDDQWHNAYKNGNSPKKSYQHKRMSSLFKHVAPDESVTYYDIDRGQSYDQNSYFFLAQQVNNVVS